MSRGTAPRRGAHRRRALAVAAALLVGAPALAQQQLPARIDPARLPGQAPTPAPAPATAPPATELPAQPRSGPPAGAENLRFTLTELRIDGATAFTAEQLRPLYAARLGTEISVADLYAMADAITERYRAGGFLISRALVPAQRIDNGVARLQVVEGFVSEVGLGPTPDAVLQARAERAVLGARPLTLRALERSILLLNDLPGVTAQGLIEPAPAGPVGAARLSVTAESARVWQGYVAVDNRGSRYVGPWQATVGGSVSSVIRAYDRVAFRVVGASPLKELRYGEIGYETPIGADGWTIAASAFVSRSDPGFTLSRFDTAGESEGFSLGASYPIIRTRAENLRISIAFTPYNSRNDLFGRRDVSPAYEDDMRPLRAALAYDIADGWGGLNGATVELSQGLNAMGASPEGRANPSRPGAQSDFTRLVAEASRLQDLGMIADGLGLLALVRGQWAFGNPLVAAEQFGVGGARIGRGYDPSEIAGDNGVAGTLELQWTAGFAPSRYSFMREATIQPYLFWDAGVVTNAKGADTPSASLASTGAGVRLWLGDAFAAAIEVAKPLTRGLGTEVLSGSDGKDPRLFVSSVIRF
ncbi:ShlB/FhaC/HecB family hemolysin secretion/activation protein [Elioraea sp.]|uniref:ShlB/FhaC/HecB family hemolysin secretion/activation protein n=1 Tax=Elioraea sp. TaxID=2185103 RepID=UPI0025C6FBCA|nr:ShlB/FhaC/HecB family hemolysin secretion/activation protein [Elioraea sp.]